MLLGFAATCILLALGGRSEWPAVGCSEPEILKGSLPPAKPPRISGAPVHIPRFHLRVLDGKGQRSAGAKVIIRFVWEWIEYPYPEHPFGAWSDAYQLTQCVTDASGSVELVDVRVQPAGWYDGKYLWSLTGKRLPRFKSVDVSVHSRRICHFTMDAAVVLRDVKRTRAATMVVRIPPACAE